jgi:hypothetical protein
MCFFICVMVRRIQPSETLELPSKHCVLCDRMAFGTSVSCTVLLKIKSLMLCIANVSHRSYV